MPPSHPFHTSVRPLCVEATAQAEPLHMRVEQNQVSVPVCTHTGHCSPPKSAHATKNFLSV